MSSTSSKEFASKKYDYVIIGGGTAGLAVAARLTEDPNVSVAVLEAGENRLNDPKIDVPAMFTTLYNDSKYDWNFKTVPQSALHNRTIDQPRGKVLGGSSAINFMMCAHASRKDLDNWAALTGDPAWGFDQLQKYYRKAETYTPDAADVPGMEIMDVALHGHEGPVQTRLYPASGELDNAFAPTFKTLGLDAKEDPRKGATLGGYKMLKFVDQTYKRSYAASAYYAPVRERKNLHVVTGAFVEKILFEEKEGEISAMGVYFTVDGQGLTFRATSEIILAAGAIQSPQLLELSGIGKKDRLERYNIAVIIDNASVGENLQDHTIVPLLYEVHEGLATAETIKQPGVLEWATGEFQAGRGGPLASGVSCTAFLSYDSVREALGQDISKVVGISNAPTATTLAQAELLKTDFLDKGEAELQINFGATGWNPYSKTLSGLFLHDDPGNFAGFAMGLTHPFSRGSVHIQSSNPTVPPLIDPKYLSHPLDVELVKEALLFSQKLSETEPMAGYLKDKADGMGKIIQPSFKMAERLTDEKAEWFAREATFSSWHPVGTCAMLPRGEGGVVDSRLKVYGVKGLRIVDASIIPLQVRGNIASAVYAIAEKAADLIKEDKE
ncbi:alcohol oxidase-3 [Coleophoma crateriformis]|uniref:Alcohol oxidase-3 n=1 Tax=Coleophoma crateriformis TaxID=565419 RepID=A0A3D8QB85_9HELO|nr:alcohol oxidase-3 [Coleophoma crateriformis]